MPSSADSSTIRRCCSARSWRSVSVTARTVSISACSLRRNVPTECVCASSSAGPSRRSRNSGSTPSNAATSSVAWRCVMRAPANASRTARYRFTSASACAIRVPAADSVMDSAAASSSRTDRSMISVNRSRGATRPRVPPGASPRSADTGPRGTPRPSHPPRQPVHRIRNRRLPALRGTLIKRRILRNSGRLVMSSLVERTSDIGHCYITVETSALPRSRTSSGSRIMASRGPDWVASIAPLYRSYRADARASADVSWGVAPTSQAFRLASLAQRPQTGPPEA